METAGIHHVTAIASEAQQNLDFYTGLLGLRLVKLTVDHDDPTTYDICYGDDLGTPGSILTFLLRPNESRGRQGSGQATAISFSVPSGALDYWKDRFGSQGVASHGPVRRFNEEVLVTVDPDGLQVELVAHPGAEERGARTGGPVPIQHGIRGLHSITITERTPERMEWLLSHGLGLRRIGRDGRRTRFVAWEQAAGSIVDLIWEPEASRGTTAVGSIHHVAFRAPDEELQEEWRRWLLRMELHVTKIQDRRYFRSIYFQQAGDVLMEIATDGPGFTVDEPPERLGHALQLPQWLASHREAIRQALPKLRLPLDGLPGS